MALASSFPSFASCVSVFFPPLKRLFDIHICSCLINCRSFVYASKVKRVKDPDGIEDYCVFRFFRFASRSINRGSSFSIQSLIMRILGTPKRLAAASNLSIHFSSKSMVVVLYFVGSSTIITYLSEYRTIIICPQDFSKGKSYDFSCRFSDFLVIIELSKSFYTTLSPFCPIKRLIEHLEK